MKLTRILASFLSVIVFVSGCTKALERVESAAGTIITAGLESGKTLIDGNIVYWESGDAICVNGVASQPVSVASPAAKADFTFAQTLAAEKKGVYPASIWASEGAVSLPAEQTALPMAAYAVSGDHLTFKAIAASAASR